MSFKGANQNSKHNRTSKSTVSQSNIGDLMPVLPVRNRTIGLRLFGQQVFNVSKERDQPSLDEPVGDASALEKSHCSCLG